MSTFPGDPPPILDGQLTLEDEMSHGSVAKNVRLHKEQHPELYCSKCLWRTGGGDCPRHIQEHILDPRVNNLGNLGVALVKAARNV